MASALNVVYSVAIVVLALGGLAFLAMSTDDQWLGETRWALWGELLAAAIFVVAMVGTLVLV